MYRFRNRQSGLTCLVAALCMLVVPMLSGCTEDAVISTAPEEQSIQVPEEFAEQQVQAERFQQWIDRMDPYVSQSPDGTYALDWHAFQQDLAGSDPQLALSLQNGATPGKDAKVILELRDGIPIANKALKEHPEGVTQTAGYWCNTYWWGRRCCYTGNDGWLAVSLMSAGTGIPGLGWGFAIYAAWAAYYMQVYGNFCGNASWAGGAWLTHL